MLKKGNMPKHSVIQAQLKLNLPGVKSYFFMLFLLQAFVLETFVLWSLWKFTFTFLPMLQSTVFSPNQSSVKFGSNRCKNVA